VATGEVKSVPPPLCSRRPVLGRQLDDLHEVAIWVECGREPTVVPLFELGEPGRPCAVQALSRRPRVTDVEVEDDALRLDRVIPDVVAMIDQDRDRTEVQKPVGVRRNIEGAYVPLALTAAIADAVEAGEARSDIDPDLAAVALAGAVIYRRLMTSRSFRDDEVEALIATVLGW
jgi:hypothetical protein